MSEQDGTSRLGLAVYGREPDPSEWVGGANAKFLHAAANKIAALESSLATARKVIEAADEFMAATLAIRVRANSAWIDARAAYDAARKRLEE